MKKNALLYILIIGLIAFLVYDKSEYLLSLLGSDEEFDCPAQEFLIDKQVTSTTSNVIELPYEVTTPARIKSPVLNKAEELVRSGKCTMNADVDWQASCEIMNTGTEKGDFIVKMNIRKNNNDSQEQIEKTISLSPGESKIVSGKFNGKCDLTHVVDLSIIPPSVSVKNSYYETIKEKIVGKKIRVKEGRTKIILRTTPEFDIPTDSSPRVSEGDELLFLDERRKWFELTTKEGESLEGQFIKVSKIDSDDIYWVFSAYFECI